jgi:hypothetical protein
MVLDSEGRVVARTDEREAFQDDFKPDPVFGSMISNAVGVTGYWRPASRCCRFLLSRSRCRTINWSGF